MEYPKVASGRLLVLVESWGQQQDRCLISRRRLGVQEGLAALGFWEGSLQDCPGAASEERWLRDDHMDGALVGSWRGLS